MTLTIIMLPMTIDGFWLRCLTSDPTKVSGRTSILGCLEVHNSTEGINILESLPSWYVDGDDDDGDDDDDDDGDDDDDDGDGDDDDDSDKNSDAGFDDDDDDDKMVSRSG